jgi:hypothetical protein
MDADGQYFPEDMLLLLEKLQPGTIVVGFRNPRADTLIRIIQSKMFGFVYRIFGFPKLRDPSSPFVLAHTNDIKFIQNCVFHLSYGFWWEFQARIASNGINVIELPVRHRKRKFGQTQVYNVSKMPRLVYSHLTGLRQLQKELSEVKQIKN